MCGITALLGYTGSAADARALVLQLTRKIRHRGPDWSGLHVGKKHVLAHERLAIIGVENGAQPLLSKDGEVVLTVNGEIYNHHDLRAAMAADGVEFATKSDCEPIVELFRAHGTDCLRRLDGVFAFVATHEAADRWMAARDPMGIMPLYYGYCLDGSMVFASELKALHGHALRIELFPPGHVMTQDMDAPVRYFQPAWWDEAFLPQVELDLAAIRNALEAAVVKRMSTDVPHGLLLSGGLDSSLVASIAVRHQTERRGSVAGAAGEAWWPVTHSFCIGLEGSPDLAAAEEVAAMLGTRHHSLHFTLDEAVNAISDVIYTLETFDVTTIRASTPMYLLSRIIRAQGIKMVLSGEGADEVFGGYLYFHKAPSAEAFHAESLRKIKALHQYDVLRANKSTAAWGVECRVPFLDPDFLRVAMSLDAREKMCTGGRMEKYVLRKAFDTPDAPYLPDKVLWRQKEQFSDGVGYSWIDHLREVAAERVTDKMFARRAMLFPDATPETKEAFWYRSIFESHFPGEWARRTVPFEKSVACSTAVALEWDEAFKSMADPSGRAVAGVHVSAYGEGQAL